MVKAAVAIELTAAERRELESLASRRMHGAGVGAAGADRPGLRRG